MTHRGPTRGERPATHPRRATAEPETAGPIAFGVLGPVRVSVAGRPIPMPSAKMRCLTAALALSGGRALSAEKLTAVLWNGEPPMSARKNLHQYVHRLRSLLTERGAGDRLVRQPTGYLLRIRRGELDWDRFEALTAAGRLARDQGDLGSAAASLAQALALWRDDALADVRSSLFLDDAAQAMAEARICAVEERMAVDLRLARHALLLPELVRLVAAHPLRERLREFQMLALYASGRKAEALSVYQDCRLTLARDLGIDPGPALGEILSAVLANDDVALSARLASQTVRRRTERAAAPTRPPAAPVAGPVPMYLGCTCGEPAGVTVKASAGPSTGPSKENSHVRSPEAAASRPGPHGGPGRPVHHQL